LWDANKYEVGAIVKHNGTIADIIFLTYIDQPSMFGGALEVTKGGLYEIAVYAYDPYTGNTGVDRTTVTVP
jgi:hypothetical protein